MDRAKFFAGLRKWYRESMAAAALMDAYRVDDAIGDIEPFGGHWQIGGRASKADQKAWTDAANWAYGKVNKH